MKNYFLAKKLDKWTRPVHVINDNWKRFFERNRGKKGIIIGCGNENYKNFGIEFQDVIFTDIAVNNITNLLSDVQHLPFKDEQFDWVYTSAVLEHVPNIFQAASEMIRILKRDGELFCGIPFLQPYHPSPHDYWRVTKEGMRYLFKDLEEVELTAGNGAVSAIAWINMRFIYNILPQRIDFIGRLYIVLLKPLQFLEKWLDQHNFGRKQYDGMQGMASGYHFIGRKR